MRLHVTDYHTVLFDMDGVITSEYNYWVAAALTVWECMANDPIEWIEGHASELVSRVFCQTQTIQRAKQAGINTNWDLGYVTLCLGKFARVNHPDWTLDGCFAYAKDFLEKTPLRAPALYHEAAALMNRALPRMDDYWEHERGFWQYMKDRFQHWYLGDKLYAEPYHICPAVQGIRGLVHQEKPILPLFQTRRVLEGLRTAGIRIGVGTGRPRGEIETPLREWGLYDYFDPNAFITYTDIEHAQKELLAYGIEDSLSKPNPYIFLKGALGREFDDYKIATGQFDDSCTHGVLVVGDAGSDILAARVAGFDFLAVLTGISGKAERPYFEQNHATYILDDISQMI